MLTLHVFVRISILIVFEFAFRCRCVDPPEQLKKCYEVGNNTFCFFRPEPQYKWVTWQDAWQTCRRNNATLPAIPNEAAQKAFESYMDFLKLVDRDDFWMAGQEVRGREWKWLNGKTDVVTARQFKGNMRDDYVQGVLTNAMLYSTDIPSRRNHFVCQFYGIACRSNGSIVLNNGCFLINSKEALNLYDARNRCVKDGGDLPVLDEPEDLSRFREIISRIPNVARVWVGWRRQWWDWIATDPVVEMKYTNWLPNHGFKSNQTCMVANMTGYKWQQMDCGEWKLFVCQTVAETQSIFIHEPMSALIPISVIIAFAALGISVLVLPIIVVVIVRKQRKARQRQIDVMHVPSDRSYQNLHDRQENQYTGLHGITHQQSEINPDYQNLSDYDDVGVTHIPSYVQIIE